MSILTVVVPVPVGSLNAQYEASRKLAEHTAECKILSMLVPLLFNKSSNLQIVCNYCTLKFKL